jgi:hypothetical protein
MTDPSGPAINAANDPWAHIVVDILIIWTKDCIVYIDAKKTLQWETTEEYDKNIIANTKFDLTKRNAILTDAAVLEASAREDLGENARDELLCLIGNAIACSIDLDYAGAQKALVSARKYLRERSEEVSRFWYLSSSFGMALVFLLFGCVIWIWRAYFETLLEPDVMWAVLAAVAGATGALLSVILRSGKLNFDSYQENGSTISKAHLGFGPEHFPESLRPWPSRRD